MSNSCASSAETAAPANAVGVIAPIDAESRFLATAFRQHRAPVFRDDDAVSSSDREAGPLVVDTEHDPVEGDALGAVSAGTPASERDTEVRIDIGRTLGRGGMAEVRLGTQPRLDRAVAVKTLRPERRSAKHKDRLVREAKIAARLEHPNIVPVHDLLPTDDGPQVVLRLVEGDTWGALMNDEGRLRVAFGVDDLLEWNLGVLMTVCRALSFAHSRGVLHRDVKPTNVMIGAFGEVYLVDWGVAFELKAPLGRESEDVAGTPAYMSPEQAVPNPALFGTWTDTYLLGSTLHQILTGRPPHAGKSLEQRAAESRAGTVVPLPTNIPAELRRILERALEPDPIRRTPHPEAFRLSIASFLRHRGALRLVERGDRALGDVHTATDDATLEHALMEGELAYRAALDEWVECPEARQGLLAVADARVGHALERGDPHAAARVLRAHPTLSSQRHRAVEEAVAKAVANEAALARIVADSNRGLGHGLRGALSVGLGLSWVAFWSYVAFVPPESVDLLVGFLCCSLLGGALFVFVRGRVLLSTRINRSSLSLTATAIAASIVWCLGASWLGISVPTVMVGLLLVWSVAVSGLAHLIDRWGAVSAVYFAAAFLVASAWPSLAPHAIASANVVLLLNQVVLNWMRQRRGFDALPAVGRSAPTLSSRAPGERPVVDAGGSAPRGAAREPRA